MFIPQTESSLWWVVGMTAAGTITIWKVENLENISSPIVTFFAARQVPGFCSQPQSVLSLAGVLRATSDKSSSGGCVFHLLYEVSFHLLYAVSDGAVHAMQCAN
jgi:hypothetical protein